MLQRRPLIWVVGFYAVLYAVLLLIIAIDSAGQVPPSIAGVTPDCCLQASKLQKQLTAEKADRDSLKAVGNRLLKAKDLRIELLQQIGTGRIRNISRTNDKARKQAQAYLEKSSLLGLFYKKRLRALIAILDTPE
jgi:Skp family chaperone for outer membrane proteins